MKDFIRKIAVILFIILAAENYVWANYRFDDLSGTSGVSFQWMILNNSGQTFGGSHSVPIDVSGDVISGNDAVLNVLSGYSEGETITDRSLNTMFWVIALETGPGRFTMNFGAPAMQYQVAANDIGLATTTYEYGNGYPYTSQYSSRKDSIGPSTGQEYFSPLWSQYDMSIYKSAGSDSEYDTVRQAFNFHQNPTSTSSQTINRPVIISNVARGTADDAPLELRMTLRDSSSGNGNIVAYNSDSWSVNDNLSTGADQWVFVPVNSFNDINSSKIYYYLTTEVANHTSARYAAQDSRTSEWVFPSEWRFNLPRYQGTTDVTRRFTLDDASHIAPGLVSVYKRRFNINEQNKRPLRVFAVDDNKRNGYFDLLLNHDIIYGELLGTKYERRESGNYNTYEITAYRPQPFSMEFYKDIADRTKSEFEEVSIPTSVTLNSSSITHDASVMPANAIRYFTINQNIPGSFRNSAEHDAVLPLHVTINIPVTEIRNRSWYNDMLNEWRTSGSIQRIFKENFDICLMTKTDGKNNPWNLSEELDRLKAYEDQIKIFLDEDRGTTTQDNAPGLITISFIIFLMDGTRDGVRPELSIVTDKTITEERDYIVVRDGTADDKWNLTFFIAPAGEYTNDVETVIKSNTVPVPQEVLESSGSTCSVSYAGIISAVLLGALMVCRKKAN